MQHAVALFGGRKVGMPRHHRREARRHRIQIHLLLDMEHIRHRTQGTRRRRGHHRLPRGRPPRCGAAPAGVARSRCCRRRRARERSPRDEPGSPGRPRRRRAGSGLRAVQGFQGFRPEQSVGIRDHSDGSHPASGLAGGWRTQAGWGTAPPIATPRPPCRVHSASESNRSSAAVSPAASFAVIDGVDLLGPPACSWTRSSAGA